MEEDTRPVDHAVRGAHGAHAGEEELAVHSVKGLGKINVDVGCIGVGGGEGVGQEGGEVDVVLNATAWEVGRLLGANGGSHGQPKAGGIDVGEEAVQGEEEGDGAV
jgi:hypothetical protein